MRRYDAIYALVSRIPEGRVMTYGQVARAVGGCHAREVGYALACRRDDGRIPWHRVINSQGKISPRRHGDGHDRQRRLLAAEGVQFTPDGRIELAVYGYDP